MDGCALDGADLCAQKDGADHMRSGRGGPYAL
jgi:hypothetical protein